jgi:large subunit ribosomal protein L25
MNDPTLKLEKRDAVGGNRAKRLLEKGLVPAVICGRGFGSAAVQVERSELKKFLKANGKSTIFRTEFAQEHDLSLVIKNIQYDPVNKEIIHLDFQKVEPQEAVQMQIPVRTEGEEAFAKAGYPVLHQLNAITIECPAGNIPKHAVADITGMRPGQSFTVADFRFPADVKVLTDPAKVVLSIKAQRSVTEPEEGERSTEILSQ